MNQYNLKFIKKNSYKIENYIISESNKLAYNFLINNNQNNHQIFLYGPKKSGKTHLANIWANINESVIINLEHFDINILTSINKNILIDNIFNNLPEEKLFHIINHSNNHNLKILLTSEILPRNHNFKINDLSSRIKSFYLIEISQPDDYLISNLIVKLFNDLQINIKNDDVITYLTTRIHRSFDNVFSIVNQIDEYSLSYKREITIPLIKEIIDIS